MNATQVFANATKQYLTGVAAEGRAGGSPTAVRGALQQRRHFYPGNVSLRGDSSQQVTASVDDLLFCWSSTGASAAPAELSSHSLASTVAGEQRSISVLAQIPAFRQVQQPAPDLSVSTHHRQRSSGSSTGGVTQRRSSAPLKQ